MKKNLTVVFAIAVLLSSCVHDRGGEEQVARKLIPVDRLVRLAELLVQLDGGRGAYFESEHELLESMVLIDEKILMHGIEGMPMYRRIYCVASAMTSQGVATVSMTFDGEVSRSAVIGFLTGQEGDGLHMSQYDIDRRILGEAVTITFIEGSRYTQKELRTMAEGQLQAIKDEEKKARKRRIKSGREL